jgi:hypothetical protein
VAWLLLAMSVSLTPGFARCQEKEGKKSTAAMAGRQKVNPADAKAQYAGPVAQAAQLTVTLEPNPSPATVNQDVQFTATPFADGQYYFIFGDDSKPQISSSNVAHHTYAAARTYQVAVRVLVHDGNQSASASTTLTVNSGAEDMTPPNEALPQITVQLTKKMQPLEGIEIPIRVSLEPSVKNEGFDINWGDGSAPERIDAAGNATHTYERATEYDVVATALTQEFGQALQGTLHLRVAERPVPPRPIQPSQQPRQSPPPWWKQLPERHPIAASAGGIVLLALLAWLLWPVPRPPVTDPSPQTDVRKPAQGLTYFAGQKSARHVTTMRRLPLHDSMTVRVGAGEAEHTIRMRGE